MTSLLFASAAFIACGGLLQGIEVLYLRKRRKTLDRIRQSLDERARKLDSWADELTAASAKFEAGVADLYSEGPIIAYKRAFVLLRSSCANPEFMDHVLRQCQEPSGPVN